jgi:hypothetical protein
LTSDESKSGVVKFFTKERSEYTEEGSTVVSCLSIANDKSIDKDLEADILDPLFFPRRLHYMHSHTKCGNSISKVKEDSSQYLLHHTYIKL